MKSQSQLLVRGEPVGEPMEEYAHRRNIERFERELACETDPRRRKALQDILAMEQDMLTRVIHKKNAAHKNTD